MDEEQKRRRRNIVGNVAVEESHDTDNLAIVLASYFSGHINRPSDDPDDAELGWGEWVLEKTNAALDLIADEIFTEATAEWIVCNLDALPRRVGIRAVSDDWLSNPELPNSFRWVDLPHDHDVIINGAPIRD